MLDLLGYGLQIRPSEFKLREEDGGGSAPIMIRMGYGPSNPQTLHFGFI